MEHKLSQQAATIFLFSGRATFTIRNARKGTRFTYRINCKRDEIDNPTIFFVKLRVGAQYKFIGTVYPTNKSVYRHGKKSEISREEPSVRNIEWVINNITRVKFSDNVEIWHEGECGRCGRPLTDPESISLGFGPDCAKKIGFEKLVSLSNYE